MGKPSAPAAPDYAGAAAQQGQANLEAARTSARLGNPNVSTPFFNETQTFNPDDTRTANITLDPSLQPLLNNFSSAINQPMDFSGAAPLLGQQGISDAVNKVSNAVYGQQTANLDPQWKMAEDNFRTNLANQGFSEGSQGWNTAMEGFQRSKAGAYQQAQNSAIQAGQGAAANEANIAQNTHQQNIADILSQRQEPMNELIGLLSGSQLNAQRGGPGVNPAPIMEGAQSQNAANQANYATQAAMYNSQMGGLYGLGGMGLMAMMMSDRRLKRNVRRIGSHRGLSVYAFEYLWGQPAVGMMADEVEKVFPAAVLTSASGYKMVHYGLI